MNDRFLQDSVIALLNLYELRGFSDQRGADQLRVAQEMLTSGGPTFGAIWRMANGAVFLAKEEGDDRLRNALLSCAHMGYEQCAQSQESFRRSLDDTRRELATKPMSGDEILDVFAEAIGAPSEDSASSAAIVHDRTTVAQAGASASGAPAATKSDGEAARRPRFIPPPTKSLGERFESLLASFPRIAHGDDDAMQKEALNVFRAEIKKLMAVADAGRTFTEFATLDKDLEQLEPRLLQLQQTKTPPTLQLRAQDSRSVAEKIDFDSASADDYSYARGAWLLCAFWNSQLAVHWPASRPHVTYAFLGYLSCLQAELRYSDPEFLLMLRVSFSICRLASHDGLMPYQFLNTAVGRLTRWLKYAVGTMLATAGPGRVAPSRVPYDTRLGDNERYEYAEILLRLWSNDADRAAAATMLLEMGGWDASRACRLLEKVFPKPEGDYEVWRNLITQMADRSKRVRVIRPNPWAPGANRMITVEHQAVAVLAADVVDRNYEVLGGDISLKGSDFHDRRVPTYICSVEF